MTIKKKIYVTRNRLDAEEYIGGYQLWSGPPDIHSSGIWDGFDAIESWGKLLPEIKKVIKRDCGSSLKLGTWAMIEISIKANKVC